MTLKLGFYILVYISFAHTQYVPDETEHFGIPIENYPTVFVAILARNKAHILPYVLHYLHEQDYPKDRIVLWIRSDHNIDNTADVIKKWTSHTSSSYHNIDFTDKPKPKSFSDEKNEADWSVQRFNHVRKLRQKALDAARRSWADNLLMLDADVLLTNKNTIRNLINQSKTIVAPMLNFTGSEFYCNFWGGINEDWYYYRSENYIDTLHRNRQGCYITALVHTVFMVNLRHQRTEHLFYYPTPEGYNGPNDDLIIFTYSAVINGMPIYILNDETYGFGVAPTDENNSIDNDIDLFIHTKLEKIIYSESFVQLQHVPLPKKDKLGFDEVYLINLVRRPDRRYKMLACFDELGIDTTIFDAVDGRNLNETYLNSLGIKMLAGYEDPHSPRPLTMGEIGCFLSHYFIWEDIVKRNLSRVVVFEDDLRFKPFFKYRLHYAMKEIEVLGLEWDIIYLGRKLMDSDNEDWVPGADTLLYPSFSYWTLAYIINISGAKKLLNQQPLGKMIAVDEYIPLMFDKNPNEEWSNAFHPRDLKALAVHPVILSPTHYTGEPGYVTDTEDSDVISVIEDTPEELRNLEEPEHVMEKQTHFEQSKMFDEL